MYIRKPELVAPAGDMEKLKTAIEYGADAVYIGAEGFNLRMGAENLTMQEIRNAVDYVHEKEKKIYVALNIYARNYHIRSIVSCVKALAEIPVDAVIVSDPGILLTIKEIAPHIKIHLSTQANTTNFKSLEFWRQQGVKRAVLARELTLGEIEEIIANTAVETEVFVHGAMCMAYSGRCLLSSYMSNRHANLGDCSHSCRWKYVLKEENRPGETFPIIQDETGTYILSSKDLCMLEYIPELVSAGITAWKIEGRMKSQYYVASVTRVYREALDSYFSDSQNYIIDEQWLSELEKTSHREFGTGFFLGYRENNPQVSHQDHAYIKEYEFLGIINSVSNDNIAEILVKNTIKENISIEIMGKKLKDDFEEPCLKMRNELNEPIKIAHAGQKIFAKLSQPVHKYFILRKCG
ncbi:U32 family peptidase [Candidatus Kuenenia sp.]|uniref:peptidase U32 family protein n=1 Tax=Candidatus Kuenenia sp. TaxID=2499824 RepID=UPI00321FBF21